MKNGNEKRKQRAPYKAPVVEVVMHHAQTRNSPPGVFGDNPTMIS